jgi:hypothetical protein
MRKIATAIAVGTLMAGPVLTAPSATAAQVAPNITTYTQPAPLVPTIEALDCAGGTGNRGCGPGWFWRDGWRGFACYPC